MAIKTAIAALEGKVVPQSVKLPLAQGRVPEPQGRRRLLRRPVRQLLRRQRLPDLRHQLHRAGDHGADRSEQVAARGLRSRVTARRPARARIAATARVAAMSLFAMQGVSKRYGGVRALQDADLVDRGRPHPCRAGRERRRQVDADQDHGRRRRARRGPHAARRRAGVVRVARGGATRPASPASSRSCR